MTGKTISKVKYRNYQEYPPELLIAAKWRDYNYGLLNTRFMAHAQREGMLMRLLALGEWELDHTSE